MAIAPPPLLAIEEPVRRLPLGYYVDNFQLVLETVCARYGDLLQPGEQAFARGFAGLPQAAQRLYVRLISRRGSCFRRDRLSYLEIPDLDGAITALVASGFADRAADAEPSTLLGLLLRPELYQMAREQLANVPSAARKDELIAHLAAALDPIVLDAEVRRRIDIVRPLHQQPVVVFRLLFFGNLSQDWSEFVLRDLGLVRFESYEMRHDLRLFPCRAALDDTLLLRQYRLLVHYLLAEGELEAAVELARTVLDLVGNWHAVARRLADRIFYHVGRTLERRADERALVFYAASSEPPARERRARFLGRLERYSEAMTLCREIAATPRDETERDFAPRFLHQLRRRRGETVEPLRRRRPPVVEMEVVADPGKPVEQVVLRALAEAGREGFFSENWLWKTLFGLAFWDIIWSPVAGAFQHPFQYGPLDQHSPDFRRARAVAIDDRLAELRRDPRPGPRLLQVWDDKAGLANSFVAWEEVWRQPVELALTHLSGEQLAWVCDRLSRDPGRYRRGLPDLFVVRPPGGVGSFDLYEVKAPGDQLRPEQTAWIHYLNLGGVPASVMKIKWGTSLVDV